MKLSWSRWYLLPAALGLLGLLLLVRILFAGRLVLVPEDGDVVLLLGLLALIMVVALYTLVRISMNYLRSLSVQRTRQETLAEHARFLRRLDHELKNPLTVLRTGMKTLTLTDLDAPQRQLVGTMESEAVRLSRLVTDLRKLADLETQPLNRRPIDLAAFASSLRAVEQERFDEAQRVLRIESPESQSVWWLDEDLLVLALHNLLDNALKYSDSGDVVQVTIAVQNELLILVRDSGMGIPADALPHVWEELYRAAGAEQVPGSGIGLALVRSIVERHGGSVAIDSELGRGTTVALRFPPALSDTHAGGGSAARDRQGAAGAAE